MRRKRSEPLIILHHQGFSAPGLASIESSGPALSSSSSNIVVIIIISSSTEPRPPTLPSYYHHSPASPATQLPFVSPFSSILQMPAKKSEGIPGPLLKTSILRSDCEAYFLNGYIIQPQRFVSDTHLQLFGLSIRDSLGCRHHDQVTVTTSPRGSRRLGSMWRSCFISKICCVLSWY